MLLLIIVQSINPNVAWSIDDYFATIIDISLVVFHRPVDGTLPTIVYFPLLCLLTTLLSRDHPLMIRTETNTFLLVSFLFATVHLVISVVTEHVNWLI